MNTHSGNCVAVQIQHYGGNQSRFKTNDPDRKQTSYSWRDTTVVMTMDAFYPPNSTSQEVGSLWWLAPACWAFLGARLLPPAAWTPSPCRGAASTATRCAAFLLSCQSFELCMQLSRHTARILGLCALTTIKLYIHQRQQQNEH